MLMKMQWLQKLKRKVHSDASRAFAIRQSMEAYGFSEQEILDAISAAGYAWKMVVE